MKTILITVSGMSPAIITETVWALSRETPAVIPDEVIVITTVPGRDGIERQLLSPRPDWGNLTVWEASGGRSSPGIPWPVTVQSF